MVEEHVRAELPGEPASVRRARSLVRDALDGWRLGDLEDTATLLVSELATNAILHAGSGFAVEVARAAGTVRVTVHDCSQAAPAVRRASSGASTGRGLAMVEQLADRWGTGRGRRPYQKSVWFELRAG